MAITNGYATLDEFKSWIGLAQSDVLDDLEIERAIEAASRAVDQFCDRQFWSTPGTRVFDARDPWTLLIDDATAIDEVATDDNADGVYETVWAAGDWQALPVNQAGPETQPYRRLRALRRTWPPRQRRAGLIRVTATWGWPEVPQAVRQATLIMAARLVKRKESPEGVAGFDQFGIVRISTRDDPDAVRLIAPYRRYPVLLA